MNFNRRGNFVSIFEFFCFRSFFTSTLNFLQAKAMENNFCEFEELVLFDLWIPDSEFRRIPNSGFVDSGF